MANTNDTNTLLLVIIAILRPPVSVLLKDGVGLHLVLSIVPTLMPGLPGYLHTLGTILK